MTFQADQRERSRGEMRAPTSLNELPEHRIDNMNEMERFTVLRQGTGGEKVKIGSGIYIDGGMLVTSEYLMRELDVTYILEDGAIFIL